MIPRLKPYYNYKELLAALTPSTGNIERFESEFAKKFGCAHGVMFSYGRSGIYALLKIWGLQNDEVICPAYTCVVVQHAIVKSGNIPVFIDCAEGSFNMDYDEMEKTITTKTRCIVVTHLFGYPMDVYRVEQIVRDAEKKFGNKIYVIQDAAHSFGAKWKDELVTKFGDAAVFGLNISKIINSVFGGMVITNHEDYYKRLIEFRKSNFKKSGILKSRKRLAYLVSVMIAFNSTIYAIVNWMERKRLLDRFVKYYDEGAIDMPADWDQMPCELEARVGLVQLKKYDEIIRLRQQNARHHIEQFRNNPNVIFLPYDENCTYSHCVALVTDRQKWVDEYLKKGVQLGILIEYSVPEMEAYRKYKRKEYPVARHYSEHTINFPNWAGLKLS